MAIRIKSSTEHRIPIQKEGDNGEWETVGFLTFDLKDTALATRLYKMYEDIDELTKQVKKDAAELDQTTDESLPNVPEELAESFTRKRLAGAQLVEQFYRDARRVLDGFLGTGACQLIFGDKNYEGMFEDLRTALEPEFKKMGLTVAQLKKAGAAKHNPKRSQNRAMR